MVKKLILFTVALAILSSIGCSDMLNAQSAKDRDLAAVVSEQAKTNSYVQNNFVSISLMEAGKYKCVTRDLTTSDDAGKFAYNIMAILSERDTAKVKTGRGRFTIYGEQNGNPIFEVHFGTGIPAPQVTLLGEFEGIEWSND